MINVSLTSAVAIIGIARALAAPAFSAITTVIRVRDDPMIPDWAQQSIGANSAACVTGVLMNGDGSATGSYDIHIGRPYAAGSGCDYVRGTIGAKVSQSDSRFNAESYTESFKCIDDGMGNTYITFAVGGVLDPEDHANVVDALQERYPMIRFRDDGICAIN